MVQITKHQQEAIFAFRDWFSSPDDYDFFLGGYAGTGKSTILPFILESCNLHPEDVAFVAPTGKAAKVMSGKLRQEGINRTCMTIHKFMYEPTPARADAIMNDIGTTQIRLSETDDPVNRDNLLKELHKLEKELESVLEDGDNPRFRMKPIEEIMEKPLRLIVCDEASMVGHSVAQDMRLLDVPILAIGDPGQLPPVQDSYGFRVNKPDAFLTEIHRQAADNPIIWLSQIAREGKTLPMGMHGNRVNVVPRRNDSFTLNSDIDAQVIVGTHKKRWALTSRMRKEFGYDSLGPMAGEPLIVCRNSRTHMAHVNGKELVCAKDAGDIVKGHDKFVLEVKDPDYNGMAYNVSALQALFEELWARKRGYYSCTSQGFYKAARKAEHIDWAWAITCHKSQGSQWRNVIVHDESRVFKGDASKWLYTAVTRASEWLTVVV